MSSNTDTTIPQHRYTAALAREIELKWQDWWDDHGTFHTPNPSGPLGDPDLLAERGTRLFVNDMFPYPSGAGLHVGHPLGFIGSDVYARFKRMTGHNVLHTMGFDAFGLPAEQYAVETGQHPAVTTAENIATYRRQLRRLGLAHDQRRSVSTTDPDYYRWTQWIFSRVFDAWFDPDAPNDDGSTGKARPIADLRAEFESGKRATPDGRPWADLSADERAKLIDSYRLAYVSDAPVNWCPGLGTVVANEEVTDDGRSERGNFPVFTRNMRQWMMRITAYADRLLKDLDLLDWSDAIKAMQRNWIGRSEGANVHFGSAAGDITVFTTRADTLFGASFMVLAPEHPYVEALTTPDQADAVAEYRRAAATKNEIDRQDDTRDKTGVFTGSYATNPLNGNQIPIWIADYVLMGYGTGAIMAVPCGDQRDFEFAKKFGLEIPAIQLPPAAWFKSHEMEPQTVETADASIWPEAYVGDAAYVNSSNATLSLNAVGTKAEGIAMTNAWLEAEGHGEATVTYKLRDWLFSRQRYWGEPFPIVYDTDGNPHLLPDEMLPVELPPTESFAPRTFDPDDADTEPETPLGRLDEWMTVTLDLGDGPQTYRRDTNVMPQWAGSCWYQLRYCDPTNHDALIGTEVERYWVGPRPEIRPDHPGGVDLYIGGVEHAVLHLLYARFWHKVLFDLGYLSSREPYARLFNQGYVQAYAYTDSRGVYVDAKKVVERDGEYFVDGEPVNREYGKMGKSLKNSVSPDEMYDAYGADTLRLYEMATGPLDASRPWETRDVVGMNRFLQRLWRNMVDENTGECIVVDTDLSDDLVRHLHRTIEVVRTEMDALRFNTAIAKLIELNNAVTKLDATPRAVAEPLVLMTAPLVPHIAEELWRILGHDDTVTYLDFPVADEAYLVDDTIEMPVQVNGKVRSRITVAPDASREALESTALADDKIAEIVDGATPRKVIVVPGRMINIVL
ncbi:MAG: leucine--tRNA ligase [Ilumatobacter coccineus]|uniref:Leucine--tRNA ligase n=1 Tax=Ilumatobacter coccineus TaxID=467094 RepID=A0A2G6KCV4_9ACTN|nr:MAG: leucine--tRNA ligase [Ilumatobacter coccineus]